MLETISQAHVRIYARYLELLALGRATDAAEEALKESADIALRAAPAAARVARVAAQDHALDQLLEADAWTDADRLLQAISIAEAALVEMLRRQESIAARLRALIDAVSED